MVLQSIQLINKLEQEPQFESGSETAIHPEALPAPADEERCREITSREDRAYRSMQPFEEAEVTVR